MIRNARLGSILLSLALFQTLAACSLLKESEVASSTVVVSAQTLRCPPVPSRLTSPKCLLIESRKSVVGRELLLDYQTLLECVSEQNKNSAEIRELQKACEDARQ